MSMSLIPIIKKRTIAGKEYIPLESYSTEELADCITDRDRFSALCEVIKRLERINSEDFSLMSDKFRIRANNLNDALIAVLSICTVLREKDCSVGEYIIFDAPEKNESPIAAAAVSPDDIPLLSEILGNENNPEIHIVDPSFRYEQDHEALFSTHPEFFISCGGVKKPGHEAVGGSFDISIAADRFLEPRDVIENYFYSNDFSFDLVHGEITRLAKRLGSHDEYSLILAAQQVIRNHLANADDCDDRDLAPEDFKNVSVTGGASKKRPSPIGSGLVGLTAETGKLRCILAALELEKKRYDMGLSSDFDGCHLVFAGPPGTAKTTLARLFAKGLSDMGLIKDDSRFKECVKSDIVGEYVGHTAGKVDRLFKEMAEDGGGVIFFDEIYTIAENNATSFDKEALTCIVQNMENYRGRVYCVFAGYENKMTDFLDANPGMRSRISNIIRFSAYDDETLCRIFISIAKKDNYNIPDDCHDILTYYFSTLRAVRKDQFGNGRDARNLFINAKQQHANALISGKKPSKKFYTTILIDDIRKASEEILSSELRGSSSCTIGF